MVWNKMNNLNKNYITNLQIETLAEMKVNFEIYFIVRYAPHWSLPIIFVNIHRRSTTREKQWCFNNNSENNGKNYLIEIKLDSYKLF